MFLKLLMHGANGNNFAFIDFSFILGKTSERVHMSIRTRARILWRIQGDARVQVSILGSEIIVQYVKKKSYELVSNSEWLPTWSCVIYRPTSLDFCSRDSVKSEVYRM